MTIRVGIYGYGNLGKGVEKALRAAPDMELAGVFTRRNPDSITLLDGSHARSVADALTMKDAIDVMILCGGSATDLPTQTPQMAEFFHVVDSFDTHANIPQHFAAVDAVCKNACTVGIISGGWDPGLFSINRALMEAVLPQGNTYTFWGRGVSQGHSEAIRGIRDVLAAVQYTVPVPSAIESVRNLENPTFTTRQKHTRECFVVAKEGADLARIEQEIKTMENYFADYDTFVTFITMEELQQKHSAMPHGGFVMRSGTTGEGEALQNHSLEFGLQLQSNPEFTSSVLVACARAAIRFAQQKAYGAKTVLDIPIGYYSQQSAEELRKTLL